MQQPDLLTRLREAVATAKQPHYGYNDTEIDHLWEAIDLIEAIIKDLEKTDDIR